MSEVKINAALVQAYAGLALGLQTSYEAKDFTPPSGTPWTAIWMLPASAQPNTLGVGGTDEHLGIFQIDINVPLNDGTARLLGYADSVAGGFVAGKRFTYQSQCVLIRSCERGRIRNEDGWLRMSISIYWTANVVRPEV